MKTSEIIKLIKAKDQYKSSPKIVKYFYLSRAMVYHDLVIKDNDIISGKRKLIPYHPVIIPRFVLDILYGLLITLIKFVLGTIEDIDYRVKSVFKDFKYHSDMYEYSLDPRYKLRDTSRRRKNV